MPFIFLFSYLTTKYDGWFVNDDDHDHITWKSLEIEDKVKDNWLHQTNNNNNNEKEYST